MADRRYTTNLNSDSKGPPPASALKIGDLLFPRAKDAWIPYLYSQGGQQVSWYSKEASEWQKIRQAIADGAGKIPPEARALIAEMSYDEFRARYNGNARGALAAEGLGFSVGHVAIVTGADEVVEALWGKVEHVIKRSYGEWAKEHAKDYVWLSRFTNVTAAQFAQFTQIALSEVGKPYDFFNFDLSDDAGFYCSKLVWYCASKSFSFTTDDNSDPHRGFWYSPKQLLHSRHLQAIQSPEKYFV